MHLVSVGFWVSSAESGLLPIDTAAADLGAPDGANVKKGDDRDLSSRHAESLAHRTMTVSGALATFKSP